MIDRERIVIPPVFASPQSHAALKLVVRQICIVSCRTQLSTLRVIFPEALSRQYLNFNDLDFN